MRLSKAAKNSLLLFILPLLSLWPLIFSSNAWAAKMSKEPYEIVSKIDYLPFSYKKDGCYARAFYMSMELISKGIATSNHYVFGNLQPSSAIRWRYHVAPMIHTVNPRKFAILDPSLHNKPVTPDYWIKLSGGISYAADTYSAPASLFGKSQVQKRAISGRKGYTKHKIIPHFDQIPSFKISDIANACSTVWYYIGKENLSRSEIIKKRRKLATRTQYLIQELKEQDKLNEDHELTSCAKGSYTID